MRRVGRIAEHRRLSTVGQPAQELRMDINDFTGTVPEFILEQFFVGKLDGWGIFENLVGGFQRRCTIVAEGEIVEGELILTESYTFDDDHTDTLRWMIRNIGDGKYVGDEPRLEGQADGQRAGCAFHWTYRRSTPSIDGSSTKLNFNDWFYLIEPNVCIVRGSAGRAGLPFGTAHVTYRRR
jgi:hypothetical protein